MYVRGFIRDGEGKEDDFPPSPPPLIHHSLAAEGHLSSVVSGSRHGFSSLLVLGPGGTLNKTRRSEPVSDFTNYLQVPEI